VPNGSALTPGFRQFQLDGEVERRYEAMGEGGKIAVTGFLSRGRMGNFDDALALAALTDSVPDTADVRQYKSRIGIAFNAEQSLTDDLALFARGGVDQDNVESYEYTDIDRTLAAGLSVTGNFWGRKDDTIGAADVVNWIGRAHEAYFAGGGLGILVGDGALPHPGPEDILEVYYNAALLKEVHLTLDGQFIDNSAYNRDRGPAVVVGGRLHAEI
jgi:high affinity Mn2+ porin